MRENSSLSKTIQFDDKNLKDLIKAFKKVPVARVGVLGHHASRRGKTEETNASIGARHEYGIGIERRSFLRVPISDKLQSYLESMGAFDKDSIKKVIKEKSLFSWVQKIGVIGELIVGDAFASGGFGLWKPSNFKYKKNWQTLVETKQLRDSISSEVKG